MEKKMSWNKPVCMTVAQEELNAKVMVASCSAWFACPLYLFAVPTDEPVKK